MKRRATSVLGWVLPPAAVVLVALVYEPDAYRASSTIERGGIIEPGGGEINTAQRAASAGVEPNESTPSVPLASTDSDEKWSAEALPDLSPADEDAARKRVREDATRAIRRVYSLLVPDLGLTAHEKEALFSQLIEDRIASTWTAYKRGKTIDEHERADRIAAIIGDARLREFLALEQNLHAYGHVRNVESLLQHYGVPLTQSQRDGMLKILIGIRKQYGVPGRSGIEGGPLERLEHTLSQINEQQRHVIELAPSVLSAEQVRYLFEQYQHMSYDRAADLERQRNAVAAGEEVPILGSYRGWHPMWQRHN